MRHVLQYQADDCLTPLIVSAVSAQCSQGGGRNDTSHGHHGLMQKRADAVAATG